jgi:hypothetical protein
MIPAIIAYLASDAGAPDPYTHYRGETKNSASYEYRKSLREGQRINRAKSPHGISMGGVNRAAYLAGGSGGYGAPQYTRKTYPLGKPSQALWDKYSKFGGELPQGNTGWQATLTKAPPSQSTSAQTQMFKQEVFQTRETRVAGAGIQPYKVLHQHTQSSRLNPNLAYMYKAKNTQLGAVRRTVVRFV